MFQSYNIIMVYNFSLDKILMCFRSKDPYKGLYNLVGGKIEKGEDCLFSAYRELFEETGISSDDICLKHLMDFNYPLSQCEVKVYAGKLLRDVKLIEEANTLHWIDLKNTNFFDMNKFAGEGNIGHMVEQVKFHLDYFF